MSTRVECAYGDPYCPCQDGDPCHYEPDPGAASAEGQARLRTIMAGPRAGEGLADPSCAVVGCGAPPTLRRVVEGRTRSLLYVEVGESLRVRHRPGRTTAGVRICATHAEAIDRARRTA